MAKNKKETYSEDKKEKYPNISDSEMRKFRAKEDFYCALSITIYSIKIAIIVFIGFTLFSLVSEFIINPIAKNINGQIEEIATVSEANVVSAPLFENLSKQIIALPIEKSEENNISNISDDSNKSQTGKTKFCPYCGTEIKSVYDYCTECGEKQN